MASTQFSLIRSLSNLFLVSRSWPEQRRNRRNEQNKLITELKQASKSGNRSVLPEGTKIITIPVVEMAPPTDENPQV